MQHLHTPTCTKILIRKNSKKKNPKRIQKRIPKRIPKWIPKRIHKRISGKISKNIPKEFQKETINRIISTKILFAHLILNSRLVFEIPVELVTSYFQYKFWFTSIILILLLNNEQLFITTFWLSFIFEKSIPSPYICSSWHFWAKVAFLLLLHI